MTFHRAVLMNSLGNRVCALPRMTFDSSSGQAHKSKTYSTTSTREDTPPAGDNNGLPSFSDALTG